MKREEFKALSAEELRKIGKHNLRLFICIALINHVVMINAFVHSRWFVVFIALGLFVTCTSLLANYRFTRELAGS